jgi:porin
MAVGLGMAQVQPAAVSEVSPESKTVPSVGRAGDGREWLDNNGVALGFSYMVEGFTNWRPAADTSRHALVLGSFVSTAEFDLQKMKAGRGQFFLSGQAIHGKGIGEAAGGAVQLPSNLEAQGFGKFVEAFYTDSYLDGKIRIKAGQQYADADFGLIESGATFLNASYGVLPTSPMPTYPDPRLGVSMQVETTSWFSWGIGAFRGGSLEPFSEEGETVRQRNFTVAEARVQPFSKNSSQKGTYRFGAWQQGNGAWREDGLLVRNYGVYAAADHWLSQREQGGGPGVFGRWGWSPANRNGISGYYAGGFLYQGITTRRAGDAIGIGVNIVELGGLGKEAAYELFYQFRLPKHMMLQPDLQWMKNIGGQRGSALIAGVRMGIEF